MFELLEALKVFTGLSVAGTGSYGAYYVINNNNLLSNADSSTDSKNIIISNDKELVTSKGNRSVKAQDKYYIAELKTATSNKPTKELYEADKKNFKCTFTVDKVEKEDLNCDIFKVTAENNSKKLLNLNDYKKSSNKPTTEDLKPSGTKVKIKSSVIDKLDWSKINNIEIKANSIDESEKNYGVFTLKYLVSGENAVGKTNLFIGKVIWTHESSLIAVQTVALRTDDNDKFKCSLNDIKVSKECKIFEVKEQPTTEKTYRDIEISEEIIAKNDKEKIKLDDIFVIDLKNENISEIKDLQEKIINLYLETHNPKETKSFASFKIISPLSLEESFDKDTSKPIILA